MNRRNKVLLGALTVGIATSFAAWAIPYPKPYHETVVSYYASADMVQLVGVQSYQGQNCNIYHHSWGEVTRYRKVEVLPCPQ